MSINIEMEFVTMMTRLNFFSCHHPNKFSAKDAFRDEARAECLGGGGEVWTLKVYIYKIKNCNILVIKRENLG